jgi:predicted nucleotidyltransferase
METTKNTLSSYSNNFFNKLSNYLETPMYFFGSVQRNDYFPNSSDIDVDIFTENEHSTIMKMQNYLQIEKYKFKKFVYRLEKSKQLVHGYKVKYKETGDNHFLKVEFSIYNEKYKEFVLEEHRRKIQLPFYVSYLLILLKYLYYDFSILPKFIYVDLKKFLMNICIDGKQTEFVVIDVTPEEDVEKEKEKEGVI